MEDPYAFIMEYAIIPPAQQRILDTCPFINEIPVPVNGNADKEKSLPLIDDSISTEIVDNDGVSGNLIKEACGIELCRFELGGNDDVSGNLGKEARVSEIYRSELGGNDDFCGNLAKETRASEISRFELGKNKSMKRKSPLIDDLGLSESERLELGFTNVENETVGDVEEPIDAFEDAQMVDEGANRNYESDKVSVELDEVNEAMEEDVQMVVEAANLRNVSEKVSVELDGNSSKEVLEPELGDNDGDPDNEKGLGNGTDKENLIGSNNSLPNKDNEKLKFNDTVKELKKFESKSNNINDLSSGLISEAPQGQRRLPHSILEVIQKMEGLGHGGRQGTSCGREDGGSGEAESSAQGDTRGQEVDNLCLDGKEVIEAGSPETDAQPIVTLTDLVDAEDDDILVAAIKAGWSFPRPRWWRIWKE